MVPVKRLTPPILLKKKIRKRKPLKTNTATVEREKEIAEAIRQAKSIGEHVSVFA